MKGLMMVHKAKKERESMTNENEMKELIGLGSAAAVGCARAKRKAAIDDEIGKPTREETIWACSIINKVINDEKLLGQYAAHEIPVGEFIKEAIRFMTEKFKADRQRLEGEIKKFNQIEHQANEMIGKLSKQLAEANKEIERLQRNSLTAADILKHARVVRCAQCDAELCDEVVFREDIEALAGKEGT
jgi:hypothetical protein